MCQGRERLTGEMLQKELRNKKQGDARLLTVKTGNRQNDNFFKPSYYCLRNGLPTFSHIQTMFD